MKANKGNLEKYLSTQQHVCDSWDDLQKILMRYEDSHLSEYLNHATKGLIFMHPENKKASDGMSGLSGNQNNVYAELYHWAKGEVFDIRVVQYMVDQIQKQFKYTKDLKTKLANNKEDIIDLDKHHSTFRTLM